MAISKRLKTIADLVTPGGVAADVGCDHALVPIYLLREDRVKKVIAIDKSPGSIDKAEAAAIRHGFEDKMDVRLSDGFEKLAANEADSIIISGMGGILMRRILEDKSEVTFSAKELILSPHRDVQLVKDFLSDNGFSIEHEEVLTDKKKEYCIIRAVNERFFLK